MAANPTKPASKRTNSRKPKAKPSQPGHDEIAERAYFIHTEQGSSDELANWLRAERELKSRLTSPASSAQTLAVSSSP